MTKLLPILACLVLLVTAALAAPYIYSSITKISQVQGVQTDKPVLIIADTNIAVTSSGQKREAKAEESSLPRLYTTDLKADFSFAATLATELASSDFQVANIRIVDNETVGVYNPEDTVAIFTPSKSAKEQIDSLQKTLALAKMNATKIEKIDLRYDKPTILLKK